MPDGLYGSDHQHCTKQPESLDGLYRHHAMRIEWPNLFTITTGPDHSDKNPKMQMSEIRTIKDSLTLDESPPPPLTGGPVGFPIAFALLWPVLRVIVVPLLRKVLPALLRKIADTLDSGEPGTISEGELMSLVDSHKQAMQVQFESHQP